MKFNTLYIFSVVIGLTFVLGACTKDPNNTGLEYAPQMYVSKAYEPYTQIEANKINPLGLNVREPAPYTIPRRRFSTVFQSADSSGKITGTRDVMVYNIPKDDFEMAAKVLKNPYQPTEEILAQGQVLFERYCSPCHGKQGDAKGTVAEMYKGVANLTGAAYKNLPAGHIYHVITHGKGRMWPHGSQINPDERWKVVNYVHKLMGQLDKKEEAPKEDDTKAEKDSTKTK
jgi:mono/diheme cytochrome c family protein